MHDASRIENYLIIRFSLWIQALRYFAPSGSCRLGMSTEQGCG